MFSWLRPQMASELSSSPEPLVPRRKRMKRIMTLSASTRTVWPEMQIPSPGAVCPAMVRFPLAILSSLLRSILPAISKTTVLAPLASTAARREPSPESLRFVTCMTLPPRPPVTYIPPPSAPGNALATPSSSHDGIMKRSYPSRGSSGPGSGDSPGSDTPGMALTGSEYADSPSAVLTRTLN